jgi:hypothetical protein
VCPARGEIGVELRLDRYDLLSDRKLDVLTFRHFLAGAQLPLNRGW